MDCYDNLANAIIIQAAKDYKTALVHLCGIPDGIERSKAVRDLETFFCSNWFSVLSDLDGKTLMNKIKEDVLRKAVAA